MISKKHREFHLLHLAAGVVLSLLVLSGGACASRSNRTTIKSHDLESLEQSLRAAETAFAQTMADRDLAAFERFLADGAVFSSPQRALRGKAEIVATWKRFYEGEAPPFSWKPVRAFVSADGVIGGTTGPVMDPEGNVVGQFVSTWLRQPDGTWKVVLDMSPDCG